MATKLLILLFILTLSELGRSESLQFLQNDNYFQEEEEKSTHLTPVDATYNVEINLIDSGIVIKTNYEGKDYLNEFTYKTLTEQGFINLFDSINEIYLHFQNKKDNNEIILTKKGERDIQIAIPFEIPIPSIKKTNTSWITLTLQSFDFRYFKLLQTLERDREQIYSLIELKDGRLAYGSYDHEIKILDLTTSQVVQTLKGHKKSVISVIQLKDGRLASATEDNKIKIWDLTTSQVVQKLKGDSKSVFSLIELKDGRLASASRNDTIEILDLTTSKVVQTLKGDSRRIDSVIQLKDGRLASATDDTKSQYGI